MKIHVRVVPGSHSNEMEKNDEGYIVRLTEKAEDNKANMELIKLMAKEFHVTSKDVIIKTLYGRRKIVEIKDKNP